jgi:hypothetical protein
MYLGFGVQALTQKPTHILLYLLNEDIRRELKTEPAQYQMQQHRQNTINHFDRKTVERISKENIQHKINEY